MIFQFCAAQHVEVPDRAGLMLLKGLTYPLEHGKVSMVFDRDNQKTNHRLEPSHAAGACWIL